MPKIPKDLLESVKSTQEKSKEIAERTGDEQLKESAEKSISVIESQGTDVEEETEQDMTDVSAPESMVKGENDTISSEDIKQFGEVSIPTPSDTGAEDADKMATEAKSTGRAIEEGWSLEDVKDIMKERYSSSGQEAGDFGDM